MNPVLATALGFGLLVGLALGLTGGGGSILAVPLLHFGLGLPLREAVTLSLAVVGLTSLYGALVQWRSVAWGAGLVLGVGGILGAPLGALMGQWIPDEITLVLFGVLMFVIGIRMWKGKRATEVPVGVFTCPVGSDGQRRFSWSCAAKLVIAGLFTGVLSGLFGVGGGFLIVPALLLVTAMPMERALSTSLLSIFLISLAGFGANVVTTEDVSFSVGVLFLVGSAVGMTLGILLKRRLNAHLLKRFFAVVVVVIGIWTVAAPWVM